MAVCDRHGKESTAGKRRQLGDAGKRATEQKRSDKIASQNEPGEAPEKKACHKNIAGEASGTSKKTPVSGGKAKYGRKGAPAGWGKKKGGVPQKKLTRGFAVKLGKGGGRARKTYGRNETFLPKSELNRKRQKFTHVCRNSRQTVMQTKRKKEGRRGTRKAGFRTVGQHFSRNQAGAVKPETAQHRFGRG